MHCIFDDNLNKNYPIAIIFGTLITQIIGHRTVVEFFLAHLFAAQRLPLNLVLHLENTKHENSQILPYAASYFAKNKPKSQQPSITKTST